MGHDRSSRVLGWGRDESAQARGDGSARRSPVVVHLVAPVTAGLANISEGDWGEPGSGPAIKGCGTGSRPERRRSPALAQVFGENRFASEFSGGLDDRGVQNRSVNRLLSAAAAITMVAVSSCTGLHQQARTTSIALSGRGGPGAIPASPGSRLLQNLSRDRDLHHRRCHAPPTAWRHRVRDDRRTYREGRSCLRMAASYSSSRDRRSEALKPGF